MKKLTFYIMMLLFLPLAIHAQYTGGNGRGAYSLALNGTFLSNYFKTAGNWSVAGNWSEGMLPASSENAKVAAAAVVDGNYAYQELTIASIGSVTISPGKSLTISGAIANDAGTAGLVIQSTAAGSGSLINSTNGVDGTFQRYIAHRTDNAHGWHLLSSPVVSQAIQPEFVPNPPGNSQAFYAWDEVQALWINTKDVSGNWVPGFEPNFIQGKGYLVNYLNDVTKNFAGSLNVSDISKSGLTRTATTYIGWNLLGNPFTSALLWNTGWTMSNIAPIAKIWNESGASYSDIAPGGIIPATQGFMVQVTAGTGSLVIPAAARTHSTQPWYKSTVDPIIKLKANDLSGQTFQESVVTVNPLATIGYDPGFDSHFLSGYAPEFYSFQGEEYFSTNVLPGLDSQTSIPFNFIKTEGTNYSIEAIQIDNVQTQVYLTDLKTNQTQNLSQSPLYSFTSLTGDDPARFLLSFGHVGVETHEGKTSDIYVYNNILYVSEPGESILEIYNIIGQKLVTEKTNNEPLFQIHLQAIPGYYIVKLTTGQKVTTQKVVVK